VKNFILQFLLVIFAFGMLSGQKPVRLPVKIDKVILVGNEKTQPNIILREIPFTFPDTLNAPDLLLIRNRIQNLYLFNRVELEIVQQENQNILLIMLTESWYFLPLPLLFINEHDWNKISYGVQVTHYNFRGRNEKLSAGGWLGYDPSFFIRYFNPWIGQKSRLIFGLGMSKMKKANKIFDIDEDRFGFDITLGRKLSLSMQTQLTFDMQRIKLPSEYKTFTISANGTDWVPSLSYEIRWDKRDLYEYTKKGFLISYTIRKTGFTKNQPDFWRYNFDNRVYLPLYKSLSLATRQLFTLTRGNSPIYDRIFLGFGERIRGYFDDVFPNPELYQKYTSTNISLTSLELRFPILPVRYFSWQDGPMMSQLYQNLKFGISMGIFMDSGIAWQDQLEFALPNFYTGYGLGLHFHLPYVYVLRFDYAWNDRGSGQLIIDVNASF
jgi:outer membrane protein assembly factor BamA